MVESRGVNFARPRRSLSLSRRGSLSPGRSSVVIAFFSSFFLRFVLLFPPCLPPATKYPRFHDFYNFLSLSLSCTKDADCSSHGLRDEESVRLAPIGQMREVYTTTTMRI